MRDVLLANPRYVQNVIAMTASALPENPDDWPDDPFALLGVSSRDDKSAIRKAYAARIRLYKPDHSPGEFRRIRDAYEYVLARVRSCSWTEDEQADTLYGNSAIPPAESATAFKSSVPVAPASSQLHGIEDEVTEAWQQAKSGQVVVAYQRLCALHPRNMSYAPTCLRLYWLLRISPELDRSRQPADWLAACLRASGLRGPAAELYRRELVRNPHEVLTDRSRLLLDATASAAALSDLAGWRWRAAGAIQQYGLIIEDLKRLREPIYGDSEELWLPTLMAAANQLAWATSEEIRSAFQDCCNEIEQMTNLHNSLRYQFDRLDLLRELAQSWQALGCESPSDRFVADASEVPHGWGSLLRDWWNGSYEELRSELLRSVKQIVSDPLSAFKSTMAMERCNSTAAAQFADILLAFAARQKRHDEADPSSTPVRETILHWLWVRNGGRYGLIRQELLTFCLQEAISPEVVAKVAGEMAQFHLKDGDSLFERVRKDCLLRSIFAVCMAF